MTQWFVVASCCFSVSLAARGAVIEGVALNGQPAVPVSADNLPSLPTVVIPLSGATATVRLDLRNDGNDSPALHLLQVLAFNTSPAPWESIIFSLEGDGVTFLLAPAVVPFASAELYAGSKRVTATGGPLLPGGTAVPTFFLNVLDNGGDVGTTFSTNLVISVPEPSVAVTLSLAAIACGGYRFRKKTGSPLSTSAT